MSELFPCTGTLLDKVAMKVGGPMSNAVETVLERALGAVLAGDQALREALDELPAADFRAQARRCRRLADAVADDIASTTLSRMADEYEEQAAKLLAAKRSANSR